MKAIRDEAGYKEAHLAYVRAVTRLGVARRPAGHGHPWAGRLSPRRLLSAVGRRLSGRARPEQAHEHHHHHRFSEKSSWPGRTSSTATPRNTGRPSPPTPPAAGTP